MLLNFDHYSNPNLSLVRSFHTLKNFILTVPVFFFATNYTLLNLVLFVSWLNLKNTILSVEIQFEIVLIFRQFQISKL
jgi:hypothetical protein